MTMGRAAMRGAATGAWALAGLMTVAMGLAGCENAELGLYTGMAAAAPVIIPAGAVARPVVGPTVGAAVAATKACTPNSRAPVFSRDGAEVAILSECLRAGGGVIQVGAVRHGARLDRRRIDHYEAELLAFTSPTTITWMARDEAAVRGIRGKASSTLSVYERDLTTNKDRLVTTATAPFAIGSFLHRQGEGCVLIDAEAGGGLAPRSRNYVLKDSKLTPVALPEGRSWSPYWDSIQKAFVFRLEEGSGQDRTSFSFAKAGCDGKAEAMPATFAPDGSPLRETYQAVSAPGAPVALFGFPLGGGRVPPSHLGRLDLAAAARRGTATVEPVPQAWPGVQASLLTPMLSSGGRYVGLDYSNAFFALRASDDRLVFSHPKGQAMGHGVSAFTPDETRYVLMGDDRVEVYAIEGAGR